MWLDMLLIFGTVMIGWRLTFYRLDDHSECYVILVSDPGACTAEALLLRTRHDGEL